MKTKRKTKAYWLNLWKSSLTEKEILRKAFYQLYQYTKRRKIEKHKKEFQDLNENYDRIIKDQENLKKNIEDKKDISFNERESNENSPKVNKALVLNPQNIRTLIPNFFGSFFQVIYSH